MVKRRAWEGKLLTQPDRHDEARNRFFENLMEYRRGLEAVAPVSAAAAQHGSGLRGP